MVVTVDELEAGGLAERRPSSTDRRARVIAVTEAGKRTVLEADKVLGRVRDDVLRDVEPEERQVFLDVLGRLALRPALRAGAVRAARAPSALAGREAEGLVGAAADQSALTRKAEPPAT